jgi:hypothetical protein
VNTVLIIQIALKRKWRKINMGYNKRKRFAIVYGIIKNKHPNWTHGQITHCTAYAVGYKRKDQRNEKN